MKFDITPEILQQGRLNQNKTRETPNSFAMEDGASVVNPTRPMDKGDIRKAGVMGNRAQQLLNDPAEATKDKELDASF